VRDAADADLQARDSTWDLAPLYDEDYFRSHCGLPYRRGDARWEEFFGRIADAIVAGLRPQTVLDAGCAIGFLVEALRERSVDAFGFDISEYAIEQVPAELEPYVWVASITDPIEQSYDVIVCIEVLEHLPEAHGAQAVANLCDHAGAVLFSSTPEDVTEATHQNVQPATYWAELFAGHGFFRDDTFDASVIAPHAVLLRQGLAGAHAAAHERTREELFAARNELVTTRDELVTTRDELVTTRDELVTTRDELVAARNDLLSLRSELVTFSTQLEDARR
jgi:2-polyprenyl-3-methyl-5-hydroxy-6-metoxy-1,4-benzoquinol methylase